MTYILRIARYTATTPTNSHALAGINCESSNYLLPSTLPVEVLSSSFENWQIVFWIRTAITFPENRCSEKKRWRQVWAVIRVINTAHIEATNRETKLELAQSGVRQFEAGSYAPFTPCTQSTLYVCATYRFHQFEPNYNAVTNPHRHRLWPSVILLQRWLRLGNIFYLLRCLKQVRAKLDGNMFHVNCGVLHYISKLSCQTMMIATNVTTKPWPIMWTSPYSQHVNGAVCCSIVSTFTITTTSLTLLTVSA